MARPLMTMSAAMAFWRAASSGTPFQLLAESPEISMTRRKPLIELLSISRWAKVIAEPMALRPKALRGCDISLSARSEEHTSELQSLMRISYAVFCLKKKNNTYEHKTTNTTNK